MWAYQILNSIATEFGNEAPQLLSLTEIEVFASSALVQQRAQIYAYRGNVLFAQSPQPEFTNVYPDADELACGEIQG